MKMIERLADENTENCCVCRKVVRLNGAFTPKSITCSKLCHQLFIFFQGLVCGHALCNLLRHCNGFYKTGRQYSHSSDETCTVFADPKEGSLNKQTHNRHHGKVKIEPCVLDTTGKCEASPESNILEELLQVTFDQETDADSDTDALNGNDTQQQLTSPFSSTTSSPATEKLPSLGILKLSSCQVNASQTNFHQPLHLQISSVHSETKKHKADLSVTGFSKKKNDIAHLTPDGDVLEDLPISSEDSSASVSGKRRVECGVCGEKFIETHLYVHMKAKHSEKLTKEQSELMFSCSECNKKFDKQSHLNKHLAKKHPSCEKLTKLCTICHKGFSNQIGLSVHMRHAHKTLSPKECDLCQRTFKSCKELSRHKLRDHKLRTHICHLCGKNFAYGHALKSHLDAHAGVKKHFCEVCGEGFVRMTSLCGHRASAHSKKDDIVYKCEICDSNYGTKALLNKHLFEAHFTGPYAEPKDYQKQKYVAQDQNCQMCKNDGDNASKCSLHSSISTNDSKQFICSHCGKNFSKAHYLKAHEKQHQEAKFSCDICCKRFTYKCNLKAHRSTHSSDKPFQCTVCPKKFRLKFLLEDHQRTHNRDMLFKCYICGRGLTRIPNLKRHIRVMHPEVSYGHHIFDIHESK